MATINKNFKVKNDLDVLGTGMSLIAGSITVSGSVISASFSGSGASLTNLPAAALTGVITTDHLGTGTANASTFLRGDGTWATIPAGVTTLAGMTDVTISSNTNGEILRWNGSQWINNTLAEAGIQPAGSYANLSHTHAWGDITSGKPTTLSGYGITDAAGASHSHTLDSLSNVTISSNANGEILRWNGSQWINNTLTEAGIQPAGSYASASHVHSTSDTTSGVFDVARLGTGTADAGTSLRAGTWVKDALMPVLQFAVPSNAGFEGNGRWNTIKIYTNITTGAKMPLLKILGAFESGYTDPAEINLSWYYYQSAVFSPRATLLSSATPGVTGISVGVENDKFVIAIQATTSRYLGDFFISAIRRNSTWEPTLSQFEGWTYEIDPAGELNATYVAAVASRVWTSGNHGIGSGLHADLLDGQHGSFYSDLTNATGTLAAARLPAFTGDVTSPTGSAAQTIANNAVTLAKMADIATASLIGRNSAGTGDPEVLSVATVKTLLNLTGTNTGDQTTITGNAGSATVLQTARTINGVSFNGSANITITAAAPTSLTAGNGLAGTAYNGSIAQTFTLGTPGTLSGSTTNAVTSTSHTHALSANLSAWDAITTASKADAGHNHTLNSLSDVTIASVANGEILRWNGTAWVNNTLAEAGIQPAGSVVTSVGLSVPTGLAVSNSPITGSGTIQLDYASGYTGFTTAEADKLAGIATGATVGAHWGTNLAGVPTNINSWALISPFTKFNVPNGDTTQYIRGDGSLATFPTMAGGTVTSVSAGNGMTFSTITGAGSVTLGTPDNITLTSTNTVSASSHTHNFLPGGTTAQYIRGDGTLAAFPSIPAGTVTSVSVTTANGVSGTVSNSTTTPAISLSLGAITPTSVAATGTVTGSNLSGTHTGTSSGTNTGDQTTITGNAGSATVLQTARTINGVSFNGSANITITAAAPNSLTAGNGLSGTAYNGAAARTFTLGTPSTLSGSTTNAVTTTSHTHALSANLSAWDAIATSSKLDTRGSLGTMATTISNWDSATDNGWYMGSGATNAPQAVGWYIGFVVQHNSQYITQEVWNFTGGNMAPKFRRQSAGGVWSAWTSDVSFGSVHAFSLGSGFVPTVYGSVGASNWFRSTGESGWYNETHGGGIYQMDADWVRVYGSKGLAIIGATTYNGQGGGNGGDLLISSPGPTIQFHDSDANVASWLHHNTQQHGFLCNNAYAWGAYRDASNGWVVVGNITAYASDRRLKTNIFDADMERVNRIIMGTRIRDYDWDAKAIEHYGVKIEAKLGQLGGIAQEVREVFEDAVVVNGAHNPIDGEKIDILTIQWEKYIPALVAKAQEQEHRLQAQEYRINKLEAALRKLGVME